MTSIDPALKESLLPFVKEAVQTDTADKSSSALPVHNFTFTQDQSEESTNITINVVPTDHDYFQEDISINQLINGVNKLQDILGSLPYIEIREYTQDTRLDLVFSLVEYFKRGMNTGEDISNMSPEARKEFGRLLLNDIKNMNSSKAFKDVMDTIISQIEKSTPPSEFYNKGSNTGDIGLVLRFTYGLYYNILNTRTTNIYKFPFLQDINEQGNGYQGFETDFGMAGSAVLGQFGSLANFIAPNINITTTPIWRGVRGGEGINIDMTVNLFNDTIANAINNYVLINTIIPNNMSIQRGIILGPPSLYDLKIHGSHRLFMCAGNFSCTYKGVLRKPSSKVEDSIVNKLKGYRNRERTNENSIEQIKANIRIPDVYELKLQFKSLLPNNFNNYIYRFAITDSMDKYKTTPVTEGILENSDITNKLDSWITARKGDAEKKYPKNDNSSTSLSSNS